MQVLAPLPPVESRPPFLERMGIWYLRALSRRVSRREDNDPVHELNAAERAELRRIQRAAIGRACIAGALSTVVSAVAEVLVTPAEHTTLVDAPSGLLFWGVVGGATAIASIVEILYLYWDGLRAVHGLATAAGLDLFPGGDAGQAIASAMARAALELPNPPGQLHGIDPRREASKTRLIFISLIYKLKVSVTNFVVKALVRRILGRAVVRTWLPFVAVPVTAIWNGVVCWFILREARIRAMGASAAQEMIGQLAGPGALPTTPAQHEAALRAVAATIVRTVDMHPNLLAVLAAVRRTFSLEGATATALDDTAEFLSCLQALPPDAQPLVLRVLGIAAVIDGRMTGAERALWRQAQLATGRTPDDRALRALLRAFVQGDRIPARLIERLA